MSIPVRAMHNEIANAYLGPAEKMIESDPVYQHEVAGRDSVRLAYILSHEAGNPDLWEEARANWDVMRIAEEEAARAEE